MGFIVTPPTAVPVDGDGSQNQETWGEGTGTFADPPEEALGHPGSSTLSANSVNFNAQKSGRVSRSTVDRMVRSEEGFLSSCILFEGVWNTGAATLDATLGPSRVGIDAKDDGGIALEVKIPAGSPLTLTALRDTYVNLKEDGSVEIQEVPNDDPPPVPSADYVAVWVLVTDATELTDANLADGVAAFVCLGPTIGIRSAVVTDLTLTDSGTTMPTSAGGLRFNETFWSARNSLGAHTLSEPIRKWSTGFTVNSGTADTSTTLVRRIQPAEQAWFKLTFRFENDTADKDISVDINYTSAAGNGSILSTTVYCELADKGYTATFQVDWKPSDDAIATTEDFTFTVNLGTVLGLLSADFIALTAESNFAV